MKTIPNPAPKRRRQGRGSQEFARKVRRAHGDHCHLCGGYIDPDLKWTGPTGMSFVADHIIPVSEGGRERDVSNALPAHARCNSLRGTLPPDVARRKIAGQKVSPSGCTPGDNTVGEFPGGTFDLAPDWVECAAHPGCWLPATPFSDEHPHADSGKCTNFP